MVRDKSAQHDKLINDNEVGQNGYEDREHEFSLLKMEIDRLHLIIR